MHLLRYTHFIFIPQLSNKLEFHSWPNTAKFSITWLLSATRKIPRWSAIQIMWGPLKGHHQISSAHILHLCVHNSSLRNNRQRKQQFPLCIQTETVILAELKAAAPSNLHQSNIQRLRSPLLKQVSVAHFYRNNYLLTKSILRSALARKRTNQPFQVEEIQVG